MSDNNTPTVLWGLKDLQKYFGFGRNKALALMGLKTFPSIKIGRTYFVEEQEVYAWVRKNAKNEITL